MQTRSLVSTFTAMLLVVGAIACSDSTAPAGSSLNGSADFETSVTPDLAPSAGEEIATDYSFMSGADLTSSGASFSVNAPGATIVGAGVSASVNTPPPSSGSATWISPSCVFNPATGRFNCPAMTRGTQTFTTSYALFDNNGTTLSAYDKVTTASINFIVADTGQTSFSANNNSFTDTTYRLHNRTVSTLLGDTVHTWNGSGTGLVHSTRTGQITKAYAFASTDTASGVRFRQPRSINPYPLGGTFVKNYTVVRTRQASDTTTHTTTRRVVATFNGTVTVPMTINGVAYSLNLDTHKVTKQ